MKVIEWLNANISDEKYHQEWLEYASPDDPMSVLWNNLDTSAALCFLLSTVDEIPTLPTLAQSFKNPLRNLAFSFIDRVATDRDEFRRLTSLCLLYENPFFCLENAASNAALHVGTKTGNANDSGYNVEEMRRQAALIRDVVKCPWS